MKPLSVFAALLALAGCREAEPTSSPRPVVTALARPVYRQDVGPFAGFVQPRFVSSEGFRIAGRVLSRDAEVGDLVSKGARLAAIDPTQEKLAIVAAKAGVASAMAVVADAQTAFARSKILFDRGVDPQAVFDRATQRRDTAAAQLSQAKAFLSKTEQTLGYTDLDAEFDGVVTRWRSEVGQQIDAGQPVVDLARPDVLEAEIDVPPAVAATIDATTRFAVRLQSAPAIACAGRLRETTPSADTRTRAQRLRITLETVPRAFRIGSAVTVSIAPTQPPDALIPAAAILEKDGRSFVWLATAGEKPRLQAVTVERSDADFATVGSLAPGTRVVRAGVHSIDADRPLVIEGEP